MRRVRLALVTMCLGLVLAVNVANAGVWCDMCDLSSGNGASCKLCALERFWEWVWAGGDPSGEGPN
jgi:hypothetical protein